MNGVIEAYGKEKEIHVILDNLNTHKPKNDRWLKSLTGLQVDTDMPKVVQNTSKK